MPMKTVQAIPMEIGCRNLRLGGLLCFFPEKKPSSIMQKKPRKIDRNVEIITLYDIKWLSSRNRLCPSRSWCFGDISCRVSFYLHSSDPSIFQLFLVLAHYGTEYAKYKALLSVIKRAYIADSKTQDGRFNPSLFLLPDGPCGLPAPPFLEVLCWPPEVFANRPSSP